MAQKTRMQDVVVILPGITGSVLQKDGKDIWAVSGQALWQALNNIGDAIGQLKLDGDDAEAESLGDGIRATRLIADTHQIPGLDKFDGYSAISRLITDNFQVIPGNIYDDPEDKPANFYHFPYDWRRDNRANAKLLQRLLNIRLKQWREYNDLPDAKVILLAHSMGGLVSRYYLEVLEGWRDCKALFTFGTPYRGSVNALNFLANGYKKLFLDLTEVMRSFTSVYQLLPIYEMLKVGEQYQRIPETDNLPNIVSERARNALAFHREIEAAVKQNQKDEKYRNSYKTIPIVGIQQPTLQSAELANGKLTVSQELPETIDPLLKDGDGTVPYLSAIPIELSNEYRDTYIAERHSSIQKHSQVLTELRNRLKTMQVKSFADIRGPEINPELAEKPAISLSLDDLYRADEPIEMCAKILNYSQEFRGLQAQIIPISFDGDSLNRSFQQQNQEWVLTIADLAPGLYRLRVETDISTSETLAPVHDVFEVVK
jgi:triacylglycerol esterase/lipase EstA (alpha/beta hydrolase family)